MTQTATDATVAVGRGVEDLLGPASVLTRAEDAVRTRRGAEVAELLACGDWADLHAADPREDPGHVATPGGEELVRLGGEGTPMVRDLPLLELGIALGRHPLAVRAMTADLLDLRHRLPRTFTHVLDGEAEVWLARKVAGMSRAVPAATIGQVDAAVAAAITGVAPSRLLDIAEAAVIIADPAGHRARLAAQRRRYVGLGRPDDTGLRTLIARIAAGDAIYIDGVVDRVADILTLRRATDGLPELSEPDRDRVRSEALGWLARPAELLTLLAEHTPEVDPELASEDPDRPARAFALPAEVLDRLTHDLLAQLRPTATLYVHLHQDALATLEPWQTRAGVARPEGLPPLDVESLADLLGHHRVTVKPVIDSREHHAVDAYEHPAWIRERIHLARPADTFPHASRVSRDLDLDHPVPWDPGGPPGQTSTESQPLSRTAHRARTHLGYVVTPTPAGVVWRTPHGLHRLVDPTGRTHRITADDAAVLTHGEDAVDRLLRRLTEES